MKNKQYYINLRQELYNECYKEASENISCNIEMETDILYQSRITAEAIVGHYLYWYGDFAREMWEENLSGMKEMGGIETDMDKEVTRIFETLTLN